LILLFRDSPVVDASTTHNNSIIITVFFLGTAQLSLAKYCGHSSLIISIEKEGTEGTTSASKFHLLFVSHFDC